jgi:hypothetical protein
MPYLLRDQISWLSASGTRWMAACGGGAAYGLALLICAVAIY